MRQPEEEDVADELGAEEAERELHHPGDAQRAQEADRLLRVRRRAAGRRAGQ